MNCYAMLGRIAEAQSIQVRLRQVGTMTTISRVKTVLPFKRQEDADLWLEAHRIAGVPE